jgi:hypothetical protein
VLGASPPGAPRATHYLLRIEWTSTADHLGGFRRSAAFPPFLALVRPFIGAVEEMQHYQPTAIRGRGSAPVER